MTEKYVRDCDNVKDITKVDFIMARQSDLIHTTDGKEWVMNNGVPEQISGGVTNIKNVAGAVTFQNTLGGAGDTNVNVGSVKFAPSDFNVTSSPTHPEQITVSAIPKGGAEPYKIIIKGELPSNNVEFFSVEGLAYINVTSGVSKTCEVTMITATLIATDKGGIIQHGDRLQIVFEKFGAYTISDFSDINIKGTFLFLQTGSEGDAIPAYLDGSYQNHDGAISTYADIMIPKDKNSSGIAIAIERAGHVIGFK